MDDHSAQSSFEPFLERAVSLSLAGLGKTFPNPIVGAVLINPSGENIGEGFHSGGAHAEVIAIEQAGRASKGATLILTLEPCNHFGKTAPCTNAIIEAGIGRVIYAITDPNPIAAGGAKKLEDHGVEVVKINYPSAPQSNRDWLTKILLDRPRMIWKIAASLDGAVAAADFSSKWITNQESRDDVKSERSKADAIITGTGTVLADNPTLLGNERNPVRIILGKRELPKELKIFSAPGETIQLGTHDFSELLDLLKARGFNRVLIEAGPTLGSALFNAGFVDEILFYQAPSILGSPHRFSSGININSIDDQIRLSLFSFENLNGNLKQVLIADTPTNKELACLPAS
jgi:diaminohydroxyphosphoribosylaminopyrimidine deaminase / 5-amino-6-(5-phosphoribosylamino)uracil reductase